jgi:hypothetical protein
MTNDRKKLAVTLAVMGIIVLAGLLFLYLFPAGEYAFYPDCPLCTRFGFYCSGCGSGRALSALVHGHIISAFKYNPLLVCLVPLLLYWFAARVVECFGRKLPEPKYRPYMLVLFMAVVVLFGILRNIFHILAPH